MTEVLSNLTDHFIPLPQFEKEAGNRMPPDVDLWSETVFAVFAEQNPELAEISGGDVEWDSEKSDFENGNAVGYIIVNSDGAVIKIPVVINNFTLEPIDIFEHQGRMYLINQENLGHVLKQQDDLGEVAYPEKSRFNTNIFTRWIAKTSSPALHRRRISRLEKIAKRYSPYSDQPLAVIKEARPEIIGEHEPVIYHVRRSGIGAVVINGYYGGEVVKVATIPTVGGLSSITDDYGETVGEAIQKVYNGHQSMLCPIEEPIPSKVGFTGVDVTRGMSLVKEPGIYNAYMVGKDGIVVKVPVYAAKLRYFGLQDNPENLKTIYLVRNDEDIGYSTQEAVVAHEGNKFDIDDSEVGLLSKCERFQKCVIVYPAETEIYHLSEPVVIDRVEVTPGGHVRVFMKAEGRSVHYLVDNDLADIMPLATTDPLLTKRAETNLTGPELMVIRVKDPADLVSSLDKHQALYDSAVVGAAEGATLTVQAEKEGEQLVIKGSYQGKRFEDAPERFIARMYSLGVPLNKAATIVGALEEDSNPISIRGVVEQDPQPQINGEAAAELLGQMRYMRDDLVKAAAGLAVQPEGRPVSTALMGMGVMDEENLRYFVQALPMLDDVANVLAKLLFNARMGLVELDAGALKSALVNVTKITSSLREVVSGV